MKARRFAHFASFLILSSLLFACGRTALDDFSDGSPPIDSSVDTLDGGPDADADGGTCMVDGDCDDGLVCNGLETCVGGSCVPGPPVFCDDGVDCTDDRCTEASGGCEFIPGICPDGTMCDPATGCISRDCMTPRDCDDGFACNGFEDCDDGTCVPGPPPFCDDGIPCTLDECSEAAGGCASRPVDARCRDDSFCNGAEICDPMIGCMPGRPVLCDDGIDCTVDLCDEMSRSCFSIPRDGDSDGFVAVGCGGLDCNDRNPLVNPRAPELCADGLDNDCNGRRDCLESGLCFGPALRHVRAPRALLRRRPR